MTCRVTLLDGLVAMLAWCDVIVIFFISFVYFTFLYLQVRNLSAYGELIIEVSSKLDFNE